jgi:hypothetical protein
MRNETGNTRKLIHLGVLLAGSLGLGALIQAILPVGEFWRGMLAGALLIFLVGVVTYLAWRRAGEGRVLAWMMLAAFALRLAYGVFLAWGLPQYGYDEAPQRAGFVYYDPFVREGNAWALAQSDRPLTDGFRGNNLGDQYGGMFTMSAFIYRFVSPDGFRPILITILAAGASALSLPFLVAALRRRFDGKIATRAGWIMALYPESILLGASQMREPFLILFFTTMLWAGLKWTEQPKAKLALIVFLLSTIGLFMFSLLVAVPITGVVILWIYVIKSPEIKQKWVKFAIWVIVVLGLLGGFWLAFDWIKEVFRWDTSVTIARSGMLQFQLERLPAWVSFPFVLVYGLFQPVLPAALAAPAPWIWKSLAIFRAVGWYALLPLLGYTFIRVWKLAPSKTRRMMIFLVLAVGVWILTSSARAGGDQWNNPRYRTIFLPWMALLAGWGVWISEQTEDRWLARVFLIEGVMVACFTCWYLSRYSHILPPIHFWLVIGVIGSVSLLIIIIGLVKDHKLRN